MMLRGMGDVATACGPNPCGFLDSLFPSAACAAWQTCAAVQNAPVATGGPCIVGGLDANGNTIVSCGGAPPCLTGAGPLQPGQDYCPGVLEAAAAAGFSDTTDPNAVGIPQWALLGGVVFVIAMLASRR